MLIEIFSLELDLITLIIGFALGIIMGYLFIVLIPKISNKKNKMDFKQLRSSLKEGHEGLIKANKSLQTIDQVLKEAERYAPN